MERVNYFKIIHKYISPDSITYLRYIPHVVLITAKALRIGRNLKLKKSQLRFIEQASMLHDIGIIKTDSKELGCKGNKPYILHILEGQKILEQEGLFEHARVARNHISVGITKEDIIEKNLPLPPEDIIPEKIEDRIISYSDLFFSKDSELLWKERTFEQVEKNVSRFGQDKLKVLYGWHREFEN